MWYMNQCCADQYRTDQCIHRKGIENVTKSIMESQFMSHCCSAGGLVYLFGRRTGTRCQWNKYGKRQ